VRFDDRGRPIVPYTEVRIRDIASIVHYVNHLPTHDRHGRTACEKLFELDPRSSVNLNSVPTLEEVDSPATCFLCLAAEAGES